MKKSTIFQLALLVFVILIGAIAIPNAPEIGDFFALKSYQPSREVEQIASDAGMGEKGRRLFYRFDPIFTDQATISSFCGRAKEPLGCAEGRRIYILASNNEEYYQQSVVTAAHEMLHVVYSRLSEKEKTQIDELIQNKIDTFGPDIVEEIDAYNKESDEVIRDESHSIVGSEVKTLPKDLENHYKTYFSNRQKSVESYRFSR
ncbi:hypothetical protein KBC31_00605 [Candidatus Saccharibacteria bacterium]|nr:hypothetical protein [Candidatus Saccharibacteria bacterium]